MNDAPAELHQLSAGIWIWHRFDRKVKADLFATAISTGSGTYLIDPFDLDPNLLFSEFGKVVGVLVTNANHLRSALTFAERLSVPISAHPDAGIPKAIPIANERRLSPDLSVIEIEGAAAGEIALYLESDGGTLIIGDALINFGSHGFTFLPAKYCSNQKRLRRSLRKLLDLRFTRMLFAHGTPIMTNARARLELLLKDET